MDREALAAEDREAIAAALNVPALVDAGLCALSRTTCDCCSGLYNRETEARALLLRVIERARGLP